MRSALTSRRRLARARARAAAPAVSATAERSGLDAALSALIAHQHLIAKVVPDLLVDARELRLEPDLGDVARPREVHAVDALHRSGSSGEDDDEVSQRDRLLEVVRDGHDRRALGRHDLEDVPDIPGDALDGLAVDEDVAFAGRLESGDERERRRLAAPGRPDDRAELAVMDHEIEVAKRGIGRPRRCQETLADMTKIDRRSPHGAYGVPAPPGAQAFGRFGRSVHFARGDTRAGPAQD